MKNKVYLITGASSEVGTAFIGFGSHPHLKGFFHSNFNFLKTVSVHSSSPMTS